MSADNGVYILRTLDGNGGYNWRVDHMQAVDNLYWDITHHCNTNNPKVHIENAKDLWGDSEVFKTEDEAWIEARRIYKKIMDSDFPVCEYGVSQIIVYGVW